MATMTNPGDQTNQTLALTCISASTLLALLVFAVARADSDMKLLALGACISQVSALMSTASTMLVGKTFDGKKLEAGPGETASATSELKVSESPKS
jgi:hypothetical protein